jgi:mRNA-degrading endonuclease RelE of RelBE toxin-antitoxin system
VEEGCGQDPVSAYKVYITASAVREIKSLPGHVRQRAKRAITNFAENPRPANSRKLSLVNLDADIWRLRIDKWRIVYSIDDATKTVDVLALRMRPPYDYGDLAQLLGNV